MKRSKLIYIYPSRSSFINSDIEFLSKNFDVKTQNLNWNSAIKLPLNLVLQKLFLLRNIAKTNVIIISFGGYFSLLPILFGKIFGKKTLLILNGTDCVSFPKYNYGSLRKPLLRFFIEKSLKYVSKLLPVDASLIQQKHTFDKSVTPKDQGFKAFFPKIKTVTTVIPNGFNTIFWNFNPLKSKEQNFITVVSAMKKSTAVFKGIDLLIEVAKKYPKKMFTVVGISEKTQKEFKTTNNVVFYPFVEKGVLKKLYQEHQFYFQLSINEGFGCALSEAMLCGCIPVISNVGALPNVAGKTAFILKNRSVFELENIIKEITNLPKEKQKELSKKSRNHIKEIFDVSIREQRFLDLIAKKKNMGDTTN